MVDVNKILGIPDEVDNSLPNKESKFNKKPIEIIIPEFNKYLRNFVEVIDIALKRGVPYEQITSENLHGIKIKYEKEIFSKKVKKFQLKSTMKGLNNILENYGFNEIYDYIESSFTDNLMSANRLLNIDVNFVGVDAQNNSIFLYFNEDYAYILLFNLIDADTELENKLKNKKNISSNILEDTKETFDLEKEKVVDAELEENQVDSYLESLNNVDEFINKFKK